MYDFLCQNFLIYYSQKELKTFWFRDRSNTRDIRTYCLKYFRVYFGTFVPKSEKQKI